MAETVIGTVTEPEEPVETETEQPSRLKAFTLNHPRTAKVVGFAAIAAIAAATLGVMQVWKNRKQNADESETDDSDEPFETDTSSEINT